MQQVAPPVIPPMTHATQFENELRRMVLDPIHKDIQTRIDKAGNSYRKIRKAIRKARPNLPPSVIQKLVVQYYASLKKFHTYRFNRSMKKHIGVEVDYLTDAPLKAIMKDRLEENVNLIKTIPKRHLGPLYKDILKLSAKAPFDQKALSEVLHNRYKSSGYNLRRITRDQTSKAVAELNEARQKQAGITHYKWYTVQDERVRHTHRANHGRVFAWKRPPQTGHPGDEIMCRCSASPVITRPLAIPRDQLAEGARLMGTKPDPYPNNGNIFKRLNRASATGLLRLTGYWTTKRVNVSDLGLGLINLEQTNRITPLQFLTGLIGVERRKEMVSARQLVAGILNLREDRSFMGQLIPAMMGLEKGGPYISREALIATLAKRKDVLKDPFVPYNDVTRTKLWLNALGYRQSIDTEKARRARAKMAAQALGKKGHAPVTAKEMLLSLIYLDLTSIPRKDLLLGLLGARKIVNDLNSPDPDTYRKARAALKSVRLKKLRGAVGLRAANKTLLADALVGMLDKKTRNRPITKKEWLVGMMLLKPRLPREWAMALQRMEYREQQQKEWLRREVEKQRIESIEVPRIQAILDKEWGERLAAPGGATRHTMTLYKEDGTRTPEFEQWIQHWREQGKAPSEEQLVQMMREAGIPYGADLRAVPARPPVSETHVTALGESLAVEVRKQLREEYGDRLDELDELQQRALEQEIHEATLRVAAEIKRAMRGEGGAMSAVREEGQLPGGLSREQREQARALPVEPVMSATASGEAGERTLAFQEILERADSHMENLRRGIDFRGMDEGQLADYIQGNTDLQQALMKAIIKETGADVEPGASNLVKSLQEHFSKLAMAQGWKEGGLPTDTVEVNRESIARAVRMTREALVRDGEWGKEYVTPLHKIVELDRYIQSLAGDGFAAMPINERVDLIDKIVDEIFNPGVASYEVDFKPFLAAVKEYNTPEDWNLSPADIQTFQNIPNAFKGINKVTEAHTEVHLKIREVDEEIDHLIRLANADIRDLKEGMRPRLAAIVQRETPSEGPELPAKSKYRDPDKNYEGQRTTGEPEDDGRPDTSEDPDAPRYASTPMRDNPLRESADDLANRLTRINELHVWRNQLVSEADGIDELYQSTSAMSRLINGLGKDIAEAKTDEERGEAVKRFFTTNKGTLGDIPLPPGVSTGEEALNYYVNMQDEIFKNIREVWEAGYDPRRPPGDETILGVKRGVTDSLLSDLVIESGNDTDQFVEGLRLLGMYPKKRGKQMVGLSFHPPRPIHAVVDDPDSRRKVDQWHRETIGWLEKTKDINKRIEMVTALKLDDQRRSWLEKADELLYLTDPSDDPDGPVMKLRRYYLEKAAAVADDPITKAARQKIENYKMNVGGTIPTPEEVLAHIDKTTFGGVPEWDGGSVNRGAVRRLIQRWEDLGFTGLRDHPITKILLARGGTEFTEGGKMQRRLELLRASEELKLKVGDGPDAETNLNKISLENYHQLQELPPHEYYSALSRVQIGEEDRADEIKRGISELRGAREKLQQEGLDIHRSYLNLQREYGEAEGDVDLANEAKNELRGKLEELDKRSKRLNIAITKHDEAIGTAASPTWKGEVPNLNVADQVLPDDYDGSVFINKFIGGIENERRLNAEIKTEPFIAKATENARIAALKKQFSERIRKDEPSPDTPQIKGPVVETDEEGRVYTYDDDELQQVEMDDRVLPRMNEALLEDIEKSGGRADKRKFRIRNANNEKFNLVVRRDTNEEVGIFAITPGASDRPVHISTEYPTSIWPDFVDEDSGWVMYKGRLMREEEWRDFISSQRELYSSTTVTVPQNQFGKVSRTRNIEIPGQFVPEAEDLADLAHRATPRTREGYVNLYGGRDTEIHPLWWLEEPGFSTVDREHLEVTYQARLHSYQKSMASKREALREARLIKHFIDTDQITEDVLEGKTSGLVVPKGYPEYHGTNLARLVNDWNDDFKRALRDDLGDEATLTDIPKPERVKLFKDHQERTASSIERGIHYDEFRVEELNPYRYITEVYEKRVASIRPEERDLTEGVDPLIQAVLHRAEAVRRFRENTELMNERLKRGESTPFIDHQVRLKNDARDRIKEIDDELILLDETPTTKQKTFAENAKLNELRKEMEGNKAVIEKVEGDIAAGETESSFTSVWRTERLKGNLNLLRQREQELQEEYDKAYEGLEKFFERKPTIQTGSEAAREAQTVRLVHEREELLKKQAEIDEVMDRAIAGIPKLKENLSKQMEDINKIWEQREQWIPEAPPQVTGIQKEIWDLDREYLPRILTEKPGTDSHIALNAEYRRRRNELMIEQQSEQDLITIVNKKAAQVEAERRPKVVGPVEQERIRLREQIERIDKVLIPREQETVRRYKTANTHAYKRLLAREEIDREVEELERLIAIEKEDVDNRRIKRMRREQQQKVWRLFGTTGKERYERGDQLYRETLSRLEGDLQSSKRMRQAKLDRLKELTVRKQPRATPPKPRKEPPVPALSERAKAGPRLPQEMSQQQRDHYARTIKERMDNLDAQMVKESEKMRRLLDNRPQGSQERHRRYIDNLAHSRALLNSQVNARKAMGARWAEMAGKNEADIPRLPRLKVSEEQRTMSFRMLLEGGKRKEVYIPKNKQHPRKGISKEDADRMLNELKKKL